MCVELKKIIRRECLAHIDTTPKFLSNVLVSTLAKELNPDASYDHLLVNTSAGMIQCLMKMSNHVRSLSPAYPSYTVGASDQ